MDGCAVRAILPRPERRGLPRTWSGYIHLAAEVQPSKIPFLQVSKGRAQLLGELKAMVQQLEKLECIVRATVYEATVIPPFDKFPNIKQRRSEIRIPTFDVAVFIETTSPSDVRYVQTTHLYRQLTGLLNEHAKSLHLLAAESVKRVNDVDRTWDGTFLFNYFVADDREVMLNLWDYLAGWYGEEMGVDNSLLLVPLDGEPSDYLAVNHARLEGTAPAFIAKQMSKSSFRKFVQANLNANGVVAMPVLYRRV